MRKDPKQDPKKFFTDEEKEKLVQAIREAEKKSSGEIRIHLAPRLAKEAWLQAQEVFEILKMNRTRERNGILFFLSLKEQSLVILGDQGIHEKVGEEFWALLKDEVLERFQKNEFTEGLLCGIERCGDELARYFSRHSEDRNELPDDISRF